jgi:hypothetical protein
MDKKHSKREILNRVADVLFSRSKPEDAVELRELSMLARVSETEALMAINYFIDDEFGIKLTDGLPRKFYCDEG